MSDFLIQIIHPIESIMMQLDERKLKNSDVKWLNHKLGLYIKLGEIAIKAEYPDGVFVFDFNKDDRLPSGIDDYGYAYNYYEQYFGIILRYFKSYPYNR